uniref:Phospholipid/glycerol acyltransferase domain-containing protein n=1 Tax=Hirondellea gigas TaxID=1518452 RepID=A0A6A7GCV4_9CRUS
MKMSFVFSGDHAPKNSTSMLIGNHSGGLDFMTGVVLSQTFGVNTGRMMTFMKYSLQFVPTIGWMNYFQGSLFLKRSWDADKLKLERKLTSLTTDYSKPFWVGLYPEGTRITNKKRIASHEFARGRNLPILQNVLLPRAKGFLILMEKLRSTFDSIIDVTTAYEGNPIYFRELILYGKFNTRAVHMNIKFHPIDSVPEDVDGLLKKWLLDSFVTKDSKLEFFKENGYFDAEHFEESDSDVTFFYVFWSVLTGLIGLYFSPFTFTHFAVWNFFVFCGVLFGHYREPYSPPNRRQNQHQTNALGEKRSSESKENEITNGESSQSKKIL